MAACVLRWGCCWIRVFTETALGFVLTLLNAFIDLVSFSEILFSIYPPLFVALVVYSVGGTWLSVIIGRVRFDRYGPTVVIVADCCVETGRTELSTRSKGSRFSFWPCPNTGER